MQQVFNWIQNYDLKSHPTRPLVGQGLQAVEVEIVLPASGAPEWDFLECSSTNQAYGLGEAISFVKQQNFVKLFIK